MISQQSVFFLITKNFRKFNWTGRLYVGDPHHLSVGVEFLTAEDNVRLGNDNVV